MFCYAQIDDDGLVVAELQTPNAIEADHMIPSSGPGLIGHTWDGDEFIAPDAPPVLRHITGLAFRRRFTKPERVAIEWAAVDRSDQTTEQRQQAAALRSDLADQSQARYIDLDDSELVTGLQTLEYVGLLGAGRADEILTHSHPAG